MENDTKICAECGASFTEAQSSGKHCFKCKCSSLAFGFRGPSARTKDDFHNNTLRSTIAEADRNITALGGSPKDYEFIGKRWV